VGQARLKLPPFVKCYADRHGRRRNYLRKLGLPSVALPGTPWSLEFMTAYNLALVGQTETALPATSIIGAALRSPPGSLAEAIALYLASTAWNELAATSRKTRRPVLDRFRESYGDLPLRRLEPVHITKLVAKMAAHAQRKFRKIFRGLIDFCLKTGLCDSDPSATLKVAKAPKTDGYYSWSDEDIARYETAHPIGSKARLALGLMLYLGLRKSDACRIGPQHIRRGQVKFQANKTKHSTGFTLECPLHPELAHIIAATPTEHLTYLVTEYGKPFTAAGFGGRMRAWCNEAGLPECSAHGLRKALGRKLAEAGASERTIASMLGHADLREAQKYTEAANKRKLAGDAVALLAVSQSKTRRTHGR
jgi:integrase